MGDMEIPDELIDQLLGEYQGPEQLTGPDGLINRLRKRLIERAAGAELEQHLGYPLGDQAPEAQPNRRNGMTSKTLRTVDGPVTVELPRDRDASFEPRIVPKHARSFDGFDEQILPLYAGGMTTREIQRHLRELYGVDVSDGLISEVPRRSRTTSGPGRAGRSRSCTWSSTWTRCRSRSATSRSCARRPSTSRSGSPSTANATASASGSRRAREPVSGRAC